jgi:hypothetical protein
MNAYPWQKSYGPLYQKTYRKATHASEQIRRLRGSFLRGRSGRRYSKWWQALNRWTVANVRAQKAQL